MRRALMKLISNLCQVPIPPPGPISIVSDCFTVDSHIHIVNWLFWLRIDNSVDSLNVYPSSMNNIFQRS